MEHPVMGRYHGKYVGFVRDVADPESRGRLRCYCPEVMGEIDTADQWLDWALPCFPWFSSEGVGKMLLAAQSSQWALWLEFRQGNPSYPVWVGVFPTNGATIDQTKFIVDSPAIYLGDGSATEQAVKGTTQRAAEKALDNALITQFAALQTASTGPLSPLAVPFGAIVTALTNYEGNDPNFLSQVVKLK